jgi:hypothetical protein
MRSVGCGEVVQGHNELIFGGGQYVVSKARTCSVERSHDPLCQRGSPIRDHLKLIWESQKAHNNRQREYDPKPLSHGVPQYD